MCKVFKECENDPCTVHSPKKKPVRMTASELQEHGVKIAISRNGTAIHPDRIHDENALAEEINRGAGRR